jgi:hypothetical protein
MSGRTLDPVNLESFSVSRAQLLALLQTDSKYFNYRAGEQGSLMRWSEKVAGSERRQIAAYGVDQDNQDILAN